MVTFGITKNDTDLECCVLTVDGDIAFCDEKSKKRLMKTTDLAFETHNQKGKRHIIFSDISQEEDKVRLFAATLARILNRDQVESVFVDIGELLEDKALQKAFMEGILLGMYRFTRYKKQEENSLRTVRMRASRFFEKESKEAEIIAFAVARAKDSINTTAIDLSPQKFAEEVQSRFKKMEQVKCTVLDEKGCKSLKMGAFLGVSKGSAKERPPCLLHVRYKGERPKKKIAIVGKGVMYDTGGLSLKPSKGMETMKADMTGAAVVMSVMEIVAQQKLPIELHAITALTDNSVGPNSFRPGDVVTASNGKSIEVLNTDAEGRLTLADALVYAEKLDVDYILDIATLTGSAAIALGPDYGAIFSKDQKSIDEMTKIGKKVGEKVWNLPLCTEYKKYLKSEIADLSNIGSIRYGGATTAALFLEEFVENTPWIHLDVAPCDFNEGKANGYKSNGALAPGVRLIAEWIKGMN